LKILLRISSTIDGLNARVGSLVQWLILVAVLVSAGNAVSRKALNLSSNGMLEIQWYLFSAVFLLCAGNTLRNNGHVRVDLVYAHLSRRIQLLIEVFGAVFFLAPLVTLMLWLSWTPFVQAWTSGEVSANAGGLIRWPVKLLIPIGFSLLLLQGFSQFIKSIDGLQRLRRGENVDVLSSAH
jgi:TRAP-type mannitol/chloroaromatic compound transport system permease small subunit